MILFFYLTRYVSLKCVCPHKAFEDILLSIQQWQLLKLFNLREVGSLFFFLPQWCKSKADGWDSDCHKEKETQNKSVELTAPLNLWLHWTTLSKHHSFFCLESGYTQKSVFVFLCSFFFIKLAVFNFAARSEYCILQFLCINSVASFTLLSVWTLLTATGSEICSNFIAPASWGLTLLTNYSSCCCCTHYAIVLAL